MTKLCLSVLFPVLLRNYSVLYVSTKLGGASSRYNFEIHYDNNSIATKIAYMKGTKLYKHVKIYFKTIKQIEDTINRLKIIMNNTRIYNKLT